MKKLYLHNTTTGIGRILILLLLIVTPLYYGSVDPWVVYLMELVVFSAIFLWFSRMIFQGRILLQRLAPAPYMGLFLLLGFFSFLQTDYKWTGRRELILYITGIGIYFLVAHLFDRPRSLRLIRNNLVAVGTALALIGILQYLGVLAHSWWAGYQLSASYVNKNHFAGYLNMVIPFAITGVYFSRDLGKRIFFSYSMIVMLCALVLTFSRGGWISLLFSSVFLSFALFESRQKTLKRAAASFFLLLVSFLLFADVGVKNLTEIPLRMDEPEINWPVRQRIYRSCLKLIRRHWLWGSGPGSFSAVFPRFRVTGLDYRIDYAHNDYLQTISDMGLGALPLIFLIIRSSFRAARKKISLTVSRTEKSVTLASMAGILSILVHSWFDFNLRIPANGFLFMVLLGLATAHPISGKNSDTRYEIRGT